MLVGLLLFSSLTLSFANIPFNNKHLEELSQWFTLSGNQVKGYWVYSDNKGDHFQVVPAVNEGDFCVDDVARVVLLYSEAYELTKDETYRKLALDASKFVLAMQDSDGEFYNFAYADGTINKQGITSYKSTSWWTLRAFLGLSKLSQFTNDVQVRDGAKRAYSSIKKYPPAAGDQLALYVMGLSEYAKVENTQDVKNTLKKYADELMNYKTGQFTYLDGFFSVYQDNFLWNGWGNHYAEALVSAYEVLGDQKYLDLAKSSLKAQIPLLLGTGLIYSIDNINGYVKPYQELAYALECIAIPAQKIYSITKDETFAYLSALSASWLYGGNRLGVRMIGDNGEGYDGLEYMHVNKNSGAESTICALRVVLHSNQLPEKFQSLVTNPSIVARSGMIILEGEGFDPGISSTTILSGNYGAGAIVQVDGKAKLKRDVSDIVPGRYYVMVSGQFPKITLTLSSKTSVKKDISGNGIFEIGQIDVENSISVSISNSCKFDQIILIPETVGVSFQEDGTTKSLVYNLSQKSTSLVDKQLFAAKTTKVNQEDRVDVKKVGTFAVLDISKFFNSDAFGTPLKPANFDNLSGIVGAYLPANEISEGTLQISNIPFEVKTTTLDNMRCNGQVMVLPERLNVKKIYILAASNHGDYNVTIGLDSNFYNMVINDWCKSPNGLAFDYRYISTGERQFITCGVSVYSIEVNNTVQKLTLPSEINVHIFAITMELSN
ncbi:MAG TPA: hypothetical protein PKW84_08450 [Fervidobacterium sp.]|nr:hypothetical protein [Fervidobacterium sp.]